MLSSDQDTSSATTTADQSDAIPSDLVVVAQSKAAEVEELARKTPGRYNAIVHALKAGEPLASITERLKVSGETVAAITRKMDLGTWKQRMSGRIGDFIAAGVERLHAEVAKIPIGQLPVAVAIALDKKAALDGDQPTTVVEHRVMKVSLRGKLSDLDSPHKVISS